MSMYPGVPWLPKLNGTEGECKEWERWKEELLGELCETRELLSDQLSDVRTRVEAQQGLLKELMSQIRPLLQQVAAARQRPPPPPQHRYTQPTRQYVRQQRDRWDDEGRPICRKCKQPGHIVRLCRVTAWQSERHVANRTRQEPYCDVRDERRTASEERDITSEERNQVLAGMLTELRDQVDELKEERSNRESAVRQLQEELADSQRKLSMSEASLEASMRCRSDLEAEKIRLLHDLNRLEKKVQESEDQRVKAERRIHMLKSDVDERDQELCTTTQRLQEAIRRLEMENARLKAVAEQQSNKMEALQKEAQEVPMQPKCVPGELEEEKREVGSEMEMEKRTVKIMEPEKAIDGMLERGQAEQDRREFKDKTRLRICRKLEEVTHFLQKQAAFQEPLDMWDSRLSGRVNQGRPPDRYSPG